MTPINKGVIDFENVTFSQAILMLEEIVSKNLVFPNDTQKKIYSDIIGCLVKIYEKNKDEIFIRDRRIEQMKKLKSFIKKKFKLKDYQDLLEEIYC